MHAIAALSASKSNRRKSFSAHVRLGERGAPVKSCVTATTFTHDFFAGVVSQTLEGGGEAQRKAPGRPDGVAGKQPLKVDHVQNVIEILPVGL
jgi:hypothetical protein